MAQDYSAILYKHYTGDGVTTDFQYDAAYLETSDVVAKVDGLPVAITSVDQGTTFRITPAPAVGTEVVLWRDSDVTAPKFTFPNPTNIKSENLDGNSDQNMFLHQESRALINESLANFGFFNASQIITDPINSSATPNDVQNKLEELFGVAFGSILWGNIGGVLNNQNDLVAALAAKTDDTSFNSHTGNLGIHYTVNSISITESQISDLGNYSDANHNHDFDYIQLTEKNQPNGVATLDTNGNLVENSNLPYLPLTGGTLTGNVSGITPTSAAHLTRKDYVDGAVSGISPAWGNITGTLSDQTDLQSALNNKLNLTGGTLTGNVSGITPTSAAHLTRKDYVDGFLPLTGGTLTNDLTIVGKLNADQATFSSASNHGQVIIQHQTAGLRSQILFNDENSTTTAILTLNADGSFQILRLSSTGIGTTLTLSDDGNLSVNGAAPTVVDHLTRKDYVDSNATISLAGTQGSAGSDRIANMVSLTQVEYDAIASPVASTLYVISG